MGSLGNLYTDGGLRHLGCYILVPVGFYVQSPRGTMESCSARPMHYIWHSPSGGIYNGTRYRYGNSKSANPDRDRITAGSKAEVSRPNDLSARWLVGASPPDS